VLAVVLHLWWRMEGTLSIQRIYTPRRELLYWLTVLSTFALGTAVGDLTATTFRLGYIGSGALFAAALAVPGLVCRFGRTDPVLSFWAACILTRTLGASFADWMGFGPAIGGLGLGHPLTALTVLVSIVALVARVSAGGIDRPSPQPRRLTGGPPRATPPGDARTSES